MSAFVTDFICHYSMRTIKIAIIYPSRGEVHPAGYSSQIAGLTETLKVPNFGLGPAKISNSSEGEFEARDRRLSKGHSFRNGIEKLVRFYHLY